MAKCLIVNADDFGYSYSINRGIIRGHDEGIITSTSVMVDGIAAAEAKQLVADYPDLSVGLHFEAQSFDLDINDELDRQVAKFVDIVGRRPDHIDIHKGSASTTPPQARQILRAYCADHKIPTRGVDAIFIDEFGIKSNDASLEGLIRCLDRLGGEYSELMTHAGYSDNYLREHSSYSDPREQELAAVCDPSVKQYLDDRGIQLISWRQVLPAISS